MLTTHQVTTPYPPSPKLNQRYLVKLVLWFFRANKTQVYYPYHYVRGQIIQRYKLELGQDLLDEDLYLFDHVLDSLELLGYGHRCVTKESPYGSHLHDFFFLHRLVGLTVNQVFWHLRMKRCVAWLEDWISGDEFTPTLQNHMILFKHRLRKCKTDVDYRNFKNLFLQSSGPLKLEARLTIRSMELVTRL